MLEGLKKSLAAYEKDLLNCFYSAAKTPTEYPHPTYYNGWERKAASFLKLSKLEFQNNLTFYTLQNIFVAFYFSL